MALKLETETLEGIDASLHGLYEKTDNGYRLSVEGVEDTNGLKTALQKERDSNKDAKARLAQLEKDREDAEAKKLEAQGKFEELSKTEREAKLQAQKELNDLRNTITIGKRDATVKDLALSMTTDKDEIDIISRFAVDYMVIDGNEVTFNKPIEQVKLELGRFVRSKASGSGDKGGSGGGSTTPKTFKEKQRAIFNK